MKMDLRTGEIKDFKDIDKKDLKHFIEIETDALNKRQKKTGKVSLKDHKSKLGKILTKERKEKGYSQMSRNQRRNLRKKLMIGR